MSVVGSFAVKGGNPWRLVAPMDSGGSICGRSDSVKDQKYLYTVTNYNQGTCVETCPDSTTTTMKEAISDTSGTQYICLKWVKDFFSTTIPGQPYSYNKAALTSYIQSNCLRNGIFDPSFNFDVTTGTCGCNIIYPTNQWYSRCVFKNPDLITKYNNEVFISLLVI